MILFRKTAYDCRQATLLSIKREEGKIGFRESLKLYYHLLRCDPCRRLIEQSALLNKVLSEGNGMVNDQPTHALSDVARERMRRALNQMNS
jgi:predicted anti-sigma-YlaC factor YlaD